MEVREKIQNLEDELNEHIIEREDAVRGILNAVLTREHVFLLGVTGTAKSMLIKCLNESITDSRYFEYLIFQGTKPSELFGEVDVSKLVDGRTVRLTENRLPDCHFAFLDEIWKGNSTILNGMLKIINEREFRNDNELQNVPLETVMSASNELPEEENLDALWDRFLLRYVVNYVENDESLEKIMKQSEGVEMDTKLTIDEIHDAQDEVEDVNIPQNIYDDLKYVRKSLKNEGMIPSDRRMGAIPTVIRAEAWMNGRDSVTSDDLNILTHMLWDDTTEIQKVKEIVINIVNPKLREADELFDDIMDDYKRFQQAKKDKKTKISGDVVMSINKAKRDLMDIKKIMEHDNRDTSKVEGYIEKADEKSDEVYEETTGL